MSSDSVCSLVVLHFQRSRIPGYSLFHPEEEIQPGQLPPCLPPLHHVHPLVDWHQVGPRWTMWVKGWEGKRMLRGCVDIVQYCCMQFITLIFSLKISKHWPLLVAWPKCAHVIYPQLSLVQPSTLPSTSSCMVTMAWLPWDLTCRSTSGGRNTSPLFRWWESLHGLIFE